MDNRPYRKDSVNERLPVGRGTRLFSIFRSRPYTPVFLKTTVLFSPALFLYLCPGAETKENGAEIRMPSAPNRTASVIRPVRTHGPGQAIASFKRKTVMSNHPKGLTGAEVEQSRQRYGANVLTPPKRKSLWRLFFEKFNDPVIRILLVAALLSLGIGFITTSSPRRSASSAQSSSPRASPSGSSTTR